MLMKINKTNHDKTPLFYAEEFFFLWRYNLREFTDTNSVICKIYVVGDDAYIVPRADVGIRPYEKRRKIYYEGYWHCQKS